MALESGTKISNLVQDNPPGTDQVAQGDDHIRLIKGVLKASFPSDVAVQIPDTTGHKGDVLTVSEDETSTEWLGAGGVQILSQVWHKIGDASPIRTYSNGWEDLGDFSTGTTTFQVIPSSPTSSILYDVSGFANIVGNQPSGRLSLRLWDTTNDALIGEEFNIIGFMHIDDLDNFEIESGFSWKWQDSSHSASPFTVSIQALVTNPEDTMGHISKASILVTETG